MKYEQIIDKFLFGQMSPEEEFLFLQECKTNNINNTKKMKCKK